MPYQLTMEWIVERLWATEDSDRQFRLESGTTHLYTTVAVLSMLLQIYVVIFSDSLLSSLSANLEIFSEAAEQ